MSDGYITADGFKVEMGEDSRGFYVRCWNVENKLHWEVRSFLISNGSMRQLRRAFTREEALAEFNRWK